jgi:4-carboxymuconolactone decarboxylase
MAEYVVRSAAPTDEHTTVIGGIISMGLYKHHERRKQIERVTWIILLIALISLDVQAQDRMPPIPDEQMTEAQKEAAAEFRTERGEPGGPWAVILRSPELINRLRGVSDYLRFNSSLPPRLSEFVILITAREWTQNYEWAAHHPLALEGGLSPDIAAAVADGRRPEGMADDEEALYDFCTALHQDGRVSDAIYARTLAEFGEQAIVDMVGLSGYYTLIAMILNTAQTPLRPGATPALEPFSR